MLRPSSIREHTFQSVIEAMYGLNAGLNEDLGDKKQVLLVKCMVFGACKRRIAATARTKTSLETFREYNIWTVRPNKSRVVFVLYRALVYIEHVVTTPLHCWLKTYIDAGEVYHETFQTCSR